MMTHLFTPRTITLLCVLFALGAFCCQAMAQQGLPAPTLDHDSAPPMDTASAQAIENDLPIAAKPSIAPYVMNNRLPVPIGVIVFALVFVGLVVFLLYKYKVL
jgi:hypothetical protein